MKCILCLGKTVKRQVEHKEFGVSLGNFPAETCEKCGETYYDEDTAGKIQQKSKELGLFGLARKVKVAEIGNSIAIRIPKEIASFMSLEKGMEVTIMPKNRHDLHIEV